MINKDQKQNNKTSFNDKKDIFILRKYIITLESVLFSSNSNNCVEYSKLVGDSSFYDPTYERNIRRKELNVFYLLDEIVLDTMAVDAGIVNILNGLEEMILSPTLYRNLIFKNVPVGAIKNIDKLCSESSYFIELLDKTISQKKYADIVANFEYLNPPKSKDTFLKNINSLIRQLIDKKSRLENMSDNLMAA